MTAITELVDHYMAALQASSTFEPAGVRLALYLAVKSVDDVLQNTAYNNEREQEYRERDRQQLTLAIAHLGDQLDALKAENAGLAARIVELESEQHPGPAGVIAVNGDGGHTQDDYPRPIGFVSEEIGDLILAVAAYAVQAVAPDDDSPSTTTVVDEAPAIPVANPCDPDTPGIDWGGLPAEYHDTINGLIQWRLKWSELPIPARRSIALYAIAWMAGEDGALTMAQFENRKPGWMPTAGAIAQLFNHRWSEVMKNAVAHARVES